MIFCAGFLKNVTLLNLHVLECRQGPRTKTDIEPKYDDRIRNRICACSKIDHERKLKYEGYTVHPGPLIRRSSMR